MKKIFFALMFFFGAFTYAQTTDSDSAAVFVSNEGTYLKSKIYLKTMLSNQKEDGFLVYEIFRNGSWQYIGNVEVTGVPVSLPLLYCFNYEDPQFRGAEFRVTCLTPGKPKMTSEPFTVEKYRYPAIPVAEIEKDVTGKIEQ